MTIRFKVGVFMANAKRYKVLVDSEVVYRGPWRTADIVYNVLVKSFNIGDSGFLSAHSVTLAFDF